jgi:hypothetical protein
MAIKPLSERLDELAGAEKNLDVLPVTDEPPQLSDIVELKSEPPTFEEVQVAGGRLDVIKEILKAPKRTQSKILKEGTEAGQVGPYQVIKDAPEATTEKILQEAPKMPTSGKPSPTTAEVQAGIPETAFNLDLIQDDDGVKQFIEATARQYGADRLEKVSYKEIATKASDEGYDEKFIARLLDPSRVTEANASDAYKMLLAITDAGRRAFDLGEKVKLAKIDGTLSSDLASEFQQAVALEGALLRATRGRQADIARTLGIFSQARQSTTARGQLLDSIMAETGGVDSVHDFASKYTALDSRGARAEMAASGYTDDLKGMYERTKDMWFSTWINGLLSSPISHAKNIAGNTFFGAYSIPEQLVASGIGKARNFLFKGGEEAIELNVVQARAIGVLQGIREGSVFGTRAFIDNAPTDAFSKIEAGRMNRNPFDFDFGDSDFGKAFSDAIKYYGVAITGPGRALMAEDEFFKGVGYRMEANALSVHESNKVFNTLVSKGIAPEDASKAANELLAELLSNPTSEIDDAAKSYSRTVTFTRELEPALQKMANLTQSPLIKMFVPFIKTPTNILMETLSRTPLALLGNPRFYNDFNAGGIRRDQAMARVTLGTTLIYSVAAGPLEGKLTGYGPMRLEDKQVFEGFGWQPFSFVFNKSDVSPELMSKFENLAKVNVGVDKVYISYAGLEPLSTLLAIGATMGEYSMQDPTGEDMSNMFIGGGLSVYNYLSDQPMLQGFGDINKIFNSRPEDQATMLYNLMTRVSKQATSFGIGGSPAGAYSSLLAAVERTMNPEKSLVIESVSQSEQNIASGAGKGFWEALGYAMSRNPLTSDSLPPALDQLTGATKTTGKGNFYEIFNPFKKSDGTYNEPYLILAEYGARIPNISKKLNGVELNDEQYTRLIELATDKDRIIKGLRAYHNDKDFRDGAARDLKGAQALLEKVISSAYSDAKKILIMTDPELRMQFREIEEMQRKEGKYKR